MVTGTVSYLQGQVGDVDLGGSGTGDVQGGSLGPLGDDSGQGEEGLEWDGHEGKREEGLAFRNNPEEEELDGSGKVFVAGSRAADGISPSTRYYRMSQSGAPGLCFERLGRSRSITGRKQSY